MLTVRKLQARAFAPPASWTMQSRLRRAYTTVQLADLNASTLPEGSIYISTSTSPYYNLSLEDWLFRRTRQDIPLLFLYRNEPCVIIGRNQNPWKEINQPALQAAAIPFVRRRSGGGTVYHDLGNTNYSLHLPRNDFDRKKGTKMVLRAVQSLGVPDVNINERNDICVGQFKVSGSAYKIINTRAYHHGTMLISAELDRLGSVLRNTKATMQGRGVSSVRSPVRNLRDFGRDLDHEKFVSSVIRSFAEEYGVEEKAVVVNEAIMQQNDYIASGVQELLTWQWKYGQTLDFQHIITGEFEEGVLTADISSKHGLVLSCELSFAPYASHSPWPHKELWEKLANDLAGERYGFVDGPMWHEDSHGGVEERLRHRFAQWLREEM